MKYLLRYAIKATILLVVTTIFVLTDNVFWMVGGSDVTSSLITPRWPIQVISLLICSAALLIPAKKITRITYLIIATAAILLGSHRLLVDNLHHRISDVYLAIPVQVLYLNPDSEFGLNIHPVFGGVLITPAGENRSLRIVSPYLIGLDPHELAPLAQ